MYTEAFFIMAKNGNQYIHQKKNTWIGGTVNSGLLLSNKKYALRYIQQHRWMGITLFWIKKIHTQKST